MDLPQGQATRYTYQRSFVEWQNEQITMAGHCNVSAALLGQSISPCPFYRNNKFHSIAMCHEPASEFRVERENKPWILFQNEVQSKINCFGKEEHQIYNVSLSMDEGFIGICRSLTWTSHLWQVRFGPLNPF